MLVLAPVSWLAEHAPISGILGDGVSHMREHRLVMVLLGTVNPMLVSLINKSGADAAGVSGHDMGLFTCVQRDPALGFVGGKANTNKLLWPYESHKNAMISGLVLWAVLYTLSEILLTK